MKKVFKTAITRGGSVLRPDTIIITEDTLTYKKRDTLLVTADTRMFDIRMIVDVKIDRHIWGTDIHIITPSERLVIKNFTRGDAHGIRDLVFANKRNMGGSAYI